jgi:hypothetical protein
MAYFIGEYPCNIDGSEIDQIRHNSGGFRLGDQLTAQHWFSSKPFSGKYADYHEKMVTYATIISSPATAIDPTATPKTFAPVAADEDGSVFEYLDTASSRAGIGGLSSRLAVGPVAIIGLGGTGSYVLDLVAKTPVRQIHLFDGDRFLQHNAFRSPGAPTLDQLKAAPFKVDYLKGIYSAMHRGIVAHAYDIIADNAAELNNMSFAFVCIDGGARKRTIIERLEQAGIPFIDTGLGVELGEDGLLGMVRLTTSTREQRGLSIGTQKGPPIGVQKGPPFWGGLCRGWWVVAGGAAERMELWVSGPPERPLGESGAGGPLIHSGGAR